MTDMHRRTFMATLLGAGTLPAAPALGRSQGFLRRHGLPAGVQLYAVDEMVRSDLTGTLSRLSAIGFRCIELAGLHGHTPAKLREAADVAGLRITGIHLGDALLGSTRHDAELLAAQLDVLGARDVVLPMFIFPRDIARAPEEPFADYLHRAVRAKGADLWRRTADLLNDRGAALAPYGIRLAYHNHNVEFEPVEGTTGWDILQERIDPALADFEIDLGWVAAAGIDPVDFISKYSGRVRQVHVKDIKASTAPNFGFRQDAAEVGAGMIDWERLLPAAYEAGARQFYVEQEPPFVTDRFVALAKSFAFLAN
ncbi:sugar phosphate isomerase/epimerase family protein [Novosphingobium guangzhouense]|uniref:Xylose isomerase-like TIM barrel domain-containing protein n=1 Tax=Novosphingobium guangzhouense TaxID=1850347 RepID=A0A2K2G3D7_9SPHN|nr:sugar phosphate isomerase/epimerase [Novosphingobium guangzhouense]PNU05508.1 hypothetical protein A8V01_16130 [Novosphingobium guangzhouense]